MIPAKEPFLNYVQQILPITYPWMTFVKKFLYCKSYMENLHRVDISSTTYQPHLVNVVKERPLSGKCTDNKSYDCQLNESFNWILTIGMI